jgi:hypothetical protein
MASPGLYPKLSEPWSDVDEEGIGEDEDVAGSGRYYYPNRDAAVAEGDYTDPHSYRESTDGGVSLSDFEDHFLKRDRSSLLQGTPGLEKLSKKRYNRNSSALYSASSSASPSIFGPRDNRASERNSVSPSVSISGVFGWVWEGALQAWRWCVAASLWKKALLTVLLGLLCSMIVSTLRLQWDTHRMDNYLPCPSETLEDLPPCIPDSEVKVAKVVAQKMADTLHQRAAQYICGVKGTPGLTLSLDQLTKKPPLKDVSRQDMKNVFYLFLVNPHWNVRWMDREHKTVTDWTHHPQPSDLLVSSSPSLPLKCSLLLRLAGLWNSIQWIMLGTRHCSC